MTMMMVWMMRVKCWPLEVEIVVVVVGEVEMASQGWLPHKMTAVNILQIEAWDSSLARRKKSLGLERMKKKNQSSQLHWKQSRKRKKKKEDHHHRQWKMMIKKKKKKKADHHPHSPQAKYSSLESKPSHHAVHPST